MSEDYNQNNLSYEERVKRADEHLKEFLRTSPISPVRDEWPNCFKDKK
ncbi:MAG: hypothetical protein Q4P14_00935 [Methanobacteriaceae archaeon]|nr:hypothetical protein [Methanobacteriaceae archaeon]